MVATFPRILSKETSDPWADQAQGVSSSGQLQFPGVIFWAGTCQALNFWLRKCSLQATNPRPPDNPQVLYHLCPGAQWRNPSSQVRDRFCTLEPHSIKFDSWPLAVTLLPLCPTSCSASDSPQLEQSPAHGRA